jgi:hypothetical protein
MKRLDSVKTIRNNPDGRIRTVFKYKNRTAIICRVYYDDVQAECLIDGKYDLMMFFYRVNDAKKEARDWCLKAD